MSGMGEVLGDFIKGLYQIIGCLLLVVVGLIATIIVLVVKF